MALLEILEYPNPRLRIKAEPVDAVDDAVRQLVADMFETMYDAPGIGLAATQVDVHRRILVLDVSEEQNAPMCLINPEILEKDGNAFGDEGCLSVPGIYEGVERADFIRATALNEQGESVEIEATGLLSVCIQHEMDHLEGKLFVDYLSELKRLRLKKKITKAQKQARTDAPAGQRI